MKSILIRLGIIVFLIAGILGVDFLSAKKLHRPLIVLEKEETQDETLVHGLFLNVHTCHKCNKQKVYFRGHDYECPKENHEKRASLTLVGDLLFEYPYYDDLEAGTSKDLYFNRVKGYFENDDLTIANMEVPIDNGHLEISGEGYSFCAPIWVGELVSSLDFEVLGTANNHSYDRDIEGIDSTIDFFKNNSDIMTIGTYKSEEDRKQHRILDINGIKFGFLAYTYGTNVDPETGDEYKVGYYADPYTSKVTAASKTIMKDEIADLRSNCDVLVVLMHWGNEFTFEYDDEQYELAQFLSDCQVDLVVGSHSHNIQPIEMVNDTLVYYSLGNFVSADEDLDRTYYTETFDNAYQVGMMATLDVVIDENGLKFENMNTEMIVNYFDDNSRNFELVPFNEYNETYEKSHQRYHLGLDCDFIQNMVDEVINP